jgi:hypothetical protein
MRDRPDSHWIARTRPLAAGADLTAIVGDRARYVVDPAAALPFVARSWPTCPALPELRAVHLAARVVGWLVFIGGLFAYRWIPERPLAVALIVAAWFYSMAAAGIYMANFETAIRHGDVDVHARGFPLLGLVVIPLGGLLAWQPWAFVPTGLGFIAFGLLCRLLQRVAARALSIAVVSDAALREAAVRERVVTVTLEGTS